MYNVSLDFIYIINVKQTGESPRSRSLIKDGADGAVDAPIATIMVVLLGLRVCGSSKKKLAAMTGELILMSARSASWLWSKGEKLDILCNLMDRHSNFKQRCTLNCLTRSALSALGKRD